MANNAFINATLKDMLEILEARSRVKVFLEENERLMFDTVVYKLYDDYVLLRTYGDRRVIGITKGLNDTSLLIEGGV